MAPDLTCNYVHQLFEGVGTDFSPASSAREPGHLPTPFRKGELGNKTAYAAFDRAVGFRTGRRWTRRSPACTGQQGDQVMEINSLTLPSPLEPGALVLSHQQVQPQKPRLSKGARVYLHGGERPWLTTQPFWSPPRTDIIQSFTHERGPAEGHQGTPRTNTPV